MTNRQFDAIVRRHIETEEISMSKLTENKLVQAMQRPEVKAATRRFTARTLVLAVVVLSLLCGVALAAVTWGAREFLTYTDDDGAAHLNEELVSYVQPVGRTFEGQALKVDIIDAIYDGSSLILTWTMQNNHAEQVYLLNSGFTANGSPLGQGSMQQITEVFLEPGETITSGASMMIEGGGGEERCEVRMHYDVLKPNGKIVRIDALDGNGTDAQRKAYTDHIDSLVSEGKVVVAPDGVIELGSRMLYTEDMTYAQILVEAGVFSLADQVDISFTLEKNTETLSALPEDGSPVEKDNGDYTLRVARADMSPNAINIVIERVFENEEALARYGAYYGEKMGPLWTFEAVDENGGTDFMHNGGGSQGEPEEMADGTWVWPYEITMTNIQYLPKTLTVISMRDDVQSDQYNVPYPDEGLVLHFK